MVNLKRFRKPIIAGITAMTVAMNSAMVFADDDTTIIADPVNIHTPVMSPAVVKDETGSFTDGAPNQLVEKSLIADTSQLRLDQYYFVHWQDLEEIGRQHRDIPTPVDGGYRGETDNPGTGWLEEDQFTNQKYMKFPFEVFYEGRAYIANTWIQIKSPNEFDENGNVYVSDDDTRVTRDDGFERVSDARRLANGELKSNNHWVDTPFYIPSYSTEGRYDDIHPGEGKEAPETGLRDDYTDCIQFKVDAINVNDKVGELEKYANEGYWIGVTPYADGAKYVATYNVPAELSGWIYGFTLTGISDKELFGGISPDEVLDRQVNLNQNYSFCDNKQDKKSGLKNRLGQNPLRYLKDGVISRVAGVAKWLEENTIALVGGYIYGGVSHPGKSNAFTGMGIVPKGTTFAYNFKTISNLWGYDEKNYCEIKPSLKYAKYNGSSWYRLSADNLKAYYSDDKDTFIPYGSEQDKSRWHKAFLGNKQFDQSYYDGHDTVTTGSDPERFGDWIDYNAYRYNVEKHIINESTMSFTDFKTKLDSGSSGLPSSSITRQMWLNRKSDNFTLSHIKIPQGLRLFAGEADQLKVNIFGVGKDVGQSGFTTYRDMLTAYGQEFKGSIDPGDDEYTYNLTAVTNSKPAMDKKFRYSMQSWYGMYFVPAELYCVDLTVHPEFRDFADTRSPYHDKYEANGGFVYGYELGLSGNNDQFTDYMQYYALIQHRDSDGLDGSEDVFLKDGYVTVHFDIYADKNEKRYLVYDGAGGGQWTTEGYVEVPDDVEPPTSPDNDGAIPTDPGDVVVVDLSRKSGDKYRAGLFNIN